MMMMTSLLFAYSLSFTHSFAHLPTSFPTELRLASMPNYKNRCSNFFYFSFSRKHADISFTHLIIAGSEFGLFLTWFCLKTHCKNEINFSNLMIFPCAREA